MSFAQCVYEKKEQNSRVPHTKIKKRIASTVKVRNAEFKLLLIIESMNVYINIQYTLKTLMIWEFEKKTFILILVNNTTKCQGVKHILVDTRSHIRF